MTSDLAYVWWYCDRCGSEGDAENRQAAESQADRHLCRGWHGVVAHPSVTGAVIIYRSALRTRPTGAAHDH